MRRFRLITMAAKTSKLPTTAEMDIKIKQTAVITELLSYLPCGISSVILNVKSMSNEFKVTLVCGFLDDPQFFKTKKKVLSTDGVH